MDNITVSDQQHRAKIIFRWFVVALLITLYGALSVTFRWWPFGFVDGINDAAQKASFDYLAWTFAAWAGASIYLLGQVATYYPKIKEASEDQADFYKYTYWYASTWLKAPVLAVVVMWLLVNLEVNVGGSSSNELGITVAFKDFPSIVMVGVAFILGFYGRVTQKQLDIIAKYLFTRAWALAEQGFELVMPSPASVMINDTYTFTTNPPAEVVWSATLGVMDPEKGTYQALKEVSDHDKEVIIRASLKDEPSASQFIKIPLKAVRIKSDSNEVKKGESIKLSPETKLEGMDLDNAKWKIGDEDPVTGKEFTFDTTNRDANKEYEISLTVKHTSTPKEGSTETPQETQCTDKLKIKVVENKEA